MLPIRHIIWGRLDTITVTMASLRCGALLLLSALLLAAAWLGVDAGCYKDKSLKKVIPQHMRYYNHKPVPLKKEHDLTKVGGWMEGGVGWRAKDPVQSIAQRDPRRRFERGCPLLGFGAPLSALVFF